MIWAVVLLPALMLAACNAQPQRVESTSNPTIPVELLFEHDGCRVYRFEIAGSTLYFTKCRNAHSSSVEWTYGKGQRMTVPTGYAG